MKTTEITAVVTVFLALIAAVAIGLNIHADNKFQALEACITEGNPPLECREAMR